MMVIFTHIGLAQHRIRTPAGCVSVVGDQTKVRLKKSPRGLIGEHGQRYQWSHLARAWYWNMDEKHQWILYTLQRAVGWTHSAQVKRDPSGQGPTSREVLIQTVDQTHLRDSDGGVWSLKPCSAVPRKRDWEKGFEEYLFRVVELPLNELELVDDLGLFTCGYTGGSEAKSHSCIEQRKEEDHAGDR